ncbi:MAG TPA: TorF family putative porin [Phenylobacterium sp.]|uniref:TorF family putative porin n=1 Tax=Phenylobacterium sp. TaxID=1871053 RepID=UPI002F92C065
MNKTLSALMAAATALALAGTAAAQDAEKPIDLSFNVGAATDYVFRGVSQTDRNPQAYAGVDATLWGLGYAGAWASNVNFGNQTDAEYDLYLGVRPTVGPVTLDLGVVYYGYAGAPSGSDQDYLEWKAAASVPAGPAVVGAALYYSDDFFGGTGPATYYEVNGSVPLNEKLTLSGAVGHQEVDYDGDYSTWNFGIGYAATDVLGFDLRYFDTDGHEFGKLYDGRVVLGLKAVF